MEALANLSVQELSTLRAEKIQRGVQLNRDYDAAPDGSEAKRTALRSMSENVREINEIDEEIERVYEGMSS